VTDEPRITFRYRHGPLTLCEQRAQAEEYQRAAEQAVRLRDLHATLELAVPFFLAISARDAALAEVARLTAEVERLTRELDELEAIRREEAL
jgi:D-aminopeptidase